MNQTQTEFVLARFREWWEGYPLKVGKLAAQKAYMKARQSGATAEQLLEGVAVYKRSKPEHHEWCGPSVWLHQGRWLDDRPDPVRRVRYGLQW